jgi:hypothetical protein
MSYRPNGALFRFNLRSMPQMIWFQALCGVLMAIPLQLFIAKQEGSGFQGEVSQSVTLWMVLMAGLLFLTRGEVVSKGLTLIRHDEFLLTRPVSRVRSYFLFIAVYFSLVVVPLAGGVAFSLIHPDLTFSLYQGKSGQTEALEKLEFYRVVFPESRVVQKPRSLVIPYGNTFVSAWWLLLLTVAAAGMQGMTLLPLPSKVKKWAPALFLVPILIAPAFSLKSGTANFVENAFLFFVSHWLAVTVGGIGCIALIQRYAWKRAQEMEVL